MKQLVIFLLGLLALISTFDAKGQADTIPLPDTVALRHHSPSTATLYSAIIPGLGQAYNQQYWKIPVIYALAGTCAYFVWYNNDQYNFYREKYYYLVDYKKRNPDEDLSDWEPIYRNEEALKRATDYYRRYRDLSAIGVIVVYALNILEANVSAHFFEYDISDNLSLQFSPSVTPTLKLQPVYGLSCSLKF